MQAESARSEKPAVLASAHTLKFKRKFHIDTVASSILKTAMDDSNFKTSCNVEGMLPSARVDTLKPSLLHQSRGEGCTASVLSLGQMPTSGNDRIDIGKVSGSGVKLGSVKVVAR